MPGWHGQVAGRDGSQYPENNQTIVKSMRPISKPDLQAKAWIRRRTLSLVAGWSALAVYLIVYAPVGIGLAALVGSFDRSHQAQVRSGERGLALVLHHGRECAEHRHGAVARVLTSFAQPTSATNPDHVIQFSTADTLSTKAQLALPPLHGSEQPTAALTEVVPVSFAHVAQELTRPRPPPGECGPVRYLRSTVLLI